jgi:diacylglycerol kinase (ATP)
MKPPGQKEVVHTYHALRWSLKGLSAALRTEVSFRVDVVLFFIFFAAGLWLGESTVEKALLVAPLFLVLALDLLNAALETVVDMVSPEYSEPAGRAKDMASAGVFVAMVTVLVVWGLVLFG